MPRAARNTDMHTCPMVTEAGSPHVGGSIIASGSANVFIEKMPAACINDMAICAGPPDTISQGSSKVFIGGKPAARMGDSTQHGGIITTGAATVNFG